MNTRGSEEFFWHEIGNLARHFASDSYYTSGVLGGAGRGRGGGGGGGGVVVRSRSVPCH